MNVGIFHIILSVPHNNVMYLNNVMWVTLMINNLITTLNIPISEGGTNSSHMHNVAQSQSY